MQGTHISVPLVQALITEGRVKFYVTAADTKLQDVCDFHSVNNNNNNNNNNVY